MNLIYGVGVNDKKYPTGTSRKKTKEYDLWRDMLKRCYGKHHLVKNPTYVGCSVSDNFKNYSYFYEWCNQQIGFNNHGYDLDKDIITRGNKIYSEDKCVFVPSQINTFFNARGRDRGNYPIGVNFDRDSGKYKAECSVNGKSKNLGRFTTPEEAFAVYKQFKEYLCKELAQKWQSQIDPRTYEAMINWSI